MSALGIVRDQPADLVILISIILHGSPTSAVNALMRIQRVLAQHTDSAVMSSNFRSVANHVGGLVDVMVARMARLFDSTTTLGEPADYQLSKHLIHTLNSLCGHPILAESLMVESLTFAFKELTRRLLETTESTNVQFKELSRLINMVIIRLFETARRIAVFRYELHVLCAPTAANTYVQSTVRTASANNETFSYQRHNQ